MWYFDPPLDNLPEQPPHPNFGIVSILSQRTFTFKNFIRQDNTWKRENTSRKNNYVFCLILCGIAPIIGGVHMLLNYGSKDDNFLVGGIILTFFGVFMTFGCSASLTYGEECDEV